MMHKMDMISTDRRDVYADIFRHDAQDGHDIDGPQGCLRRYF